MSVIPFAVLACTWVACATHVQAVVIMTRLTPPVYRPFPDPAFETRTHFYIDLNSDGIDDFDIVTTGFGISCVALTTNEIACGFIFGAPEVGGFAQKIHAGAIIGAYQDGYNYDWTPGFGTMVAINSITDPPLIYGYWGSNRDYLGLRFKIDDQTHYGWIQMHLPATEGAGFVEGFAYETEPNTSIIAGIPEPSISLLLVIGSSSLLLHRRRKRPENKTLLDNRWGGLVLGASSSLGVFPVIDAPPRPICARALTLGKKMNYLITAMILCIASFARAGDTPIYLFKFGEWDFQLSSAGTPAGGPIDAVLEAKHNTKNISGEVRLDYRWYILMHNQFERGPKAAIRVWPF